MAGILHQSDIPGFIYLVSAKTYRDIIEYDDFPEIREIPFLNMKDFILTFTDPVLCSTGSLKRIIDTSENRF